MLPDIAKFFGVSIDSLFGFVNTKNSFDETVQTMKQLFLETASSDCFNIAYKLAFYLHEGACSKGYKGYLPWDADKVRKTNDDYDKWGFSVMWLTLG